MEKKFFKNCLSVRSNGEGALPLRFTETQLKAYSRDPALTVRSFCPAGVCLDLVTDAAWFELEYTILGSARDYHYFDVCVDGLRIASPGSDSPSPGGRFRQELPASEGKKRRLTVYLAYTAHLLVKDFRLSPGSSAEPVPPLDKQLLCVGDSITQGMDARHPSCAWPVLLGRFLNMDCLNQGVGGYVFKEQSLDGEFPFQPDLIIVSYGSNDWYHSESMADLTASCARYMEKLLSIFPGKPVVVITPFWRIDWEEKRPCGVLMDAVLAIEKVCLPLPNVAAIRGMDLLPHLPELMGDKRVHPSDEGFLQIALNLARELIHPTPITGSPDA